MCGIAGIVSLNSEEFLLAEGLHRMAAKMRHRGPDDEGFLLIPRDKKPLQFFGDDTPEEVSLPLIRHKEGRHIKEAYAIPSRAGFAHRRLSIIDLTPHGHQPMSTPDGRYWIVYNGEIYNFKEVAADLKDRGVRFHGHSDTEVLLNALVEWGPEALDRLNGMFAFALWDVREKTLFCARDRIGIKPFYYTLQDNKFIFASDIKTLIASGMYPPELHLEGLYHGLSFGVAPRPMTAFKNVVALQQGHWLRIGPDGNLAKRRYWKLPVGVQDPTLTEASAASALESCLRKSVERRLVADVPVGTFMSGGIDSTTISAIAAGMHPGIKAFTLYYENGEGFNELDQAKATAAMHPVSHIIQEIKPENVRGDIRDMILGFEEPYHTLDPVYVISRVVAENGVTVILNGLGGDELFAGYDYYCWPKRWRLIKKLRPLIKFAKPFLGRRGGRLNDIAMADSADRLYTAIFSKTTEEERQNLLLGEGVKNFNTVDYLYDLYVGDELRFSDDIEAFSYMDMVNYIGNQHVYRGDQFTMRFSIEGRFPFLDHELVELAFRIPSRYKWQGKTGKVVLRNVAKKYIHPSCLQMKKKGFSVPMEQWMRGPMKDLVKESTRKLAARDFINGKEVHRRVEEFNAGRLSFVKVWILVALEIWYESFFEDRCSASAKVDG